VSRKGDLHKSQRLKCLFLYPEISGKEEKGLLDTIMYMMGFTSFIQLA
jgi:hypothetical protein